MLSFFFPRIGRRFVLKNEADTDARAKRKASEISSSSTGTDSGLSAPSAQKKRTSSSVAEQVPPTRWSLRKYPADKSAGFEETKEKGAQPEVEVMAPPQEKFGKRKGLESAAVSMDPIGLTLVADFLSSEKVDECILPEADKLLLPVAAHRLKTMTTKQILEVNVGHVLHVSFSFGFLIYYPFDF